MRLIDADVLIKHLCEIMTTANHFGNIERVSEIGACIGVIKGEKTIERPHGEWKTESAIDYLTEIGWLPEHDRILTERPQWIPCSERLPETDKKVLVNLHNTYGKDVILMASHIGYHERTSEDYGWQEFEGDTEYDEENDCFWIPECWCESNYVEDNANWIIDECEGTITHCMPLPDTYREEAT